MGASVLALTTVSGGAFAQDTKSASPPAAPADAPPSDIIVTGTRQSGVHAADSAAPIQVLGDQALKTVGQPNLINALAQNAPSLSGQSFGISLANLALSFRLRGLSPNDTLVLVDGKRRHTTSILAVFNGPFQGGASADLSFIPVASIDHVEVLQDGAAAQYGSDAIAGVVNIITRKQDHGGSLSATGGHYFDQGGMTYQLSGNIGLEPIENSWLNITGETRFHDYSFRGAEDPRVTGAHANTYPTVKTDPDYPYVNRVWGDSKQRLYNVTYDAGYDFSDAITLYSRGSYGHKTAEALQNFRLPNIAPAYYPDGFTPHILDKENDFEFTGGLRGIVSDWNWDLSSTYGRDSVDIYTTRSANAQLLTNTGSSPRSFYDGTLTASQWTNSLDITREFNMGLASPLTLAFGGVYRRDTYSITEGDNGSRYLAGGQGFPGYAITDAGSHNRDNLAGYIDVAASPVRGLKIDVAGRYEHFSDFGDAKTGKVTARYDISPAFAVRGTVSNGFRAPTLAEEYYSATNVSPTQAIVQLPPNSAAAKLLGISNLKPEKTVNFSAGIVAHPVSRVSLTIDAYQIRITDRIVGSGTVYGSGGAVNSPAVRAAILANGNSLDPTVTQTGVSVFYNGANTRTRGIDAVLTYATNLGRFGHVDWSLTGTYNKTVVTKIDANPAQLNSAVVLLNPAAISALETENPRFEFIFGANWSLGRFGLVARELIYGPSSALASYDNATFYNTRIATTPITNLEVSYKLAHGLTVAVGAENIFNVYPEKTNPALQAIYVARQSTSAVNQYPNFSPFGFDGGYYYGRATFSF